MSEGQPGCTAYTLWIKKLCGFGDRKPQMSKSVEDYILHSLLSSQTRKFEGDFSWHRQHSWNTRV